MKKLITFLFIVCTIKLSAQCTITFSLATTPASCVGCCDGNITVTNIVGSCPPYLITLNPGNINGGTGIFQNLCAGNYSITVTDAGACCLASTQTTTVGSPTSISPLPLGERQGVRFYPNPSSGKIFLSKESAFDIEIKISDVTGKIIFTDKFIDAKKELDIDLENGIYFIEFQNKEIGGTVIKKIILQK